MNTLRMLAASVAFLWSASAAVAETMGVAEKAALHATMQRHIDGRLIDGAYLHLTRATGKIRELYPVSAHPQILRVGKYFVLCSDFRDKQGKNVNIDFYIARGNDGHVVFQTIVDNRQRLGLFRKTTR